MDELKSRITSDLIHIIGITEVNCKNSKTTELCELSLLGYNMFSKLEDNRGVVLYVNKALEATPVSFKTNFSESVWVNVRLANSDSILVGCVYRSPNSSLENNVALSKLINEIALKKNDKLILIGDFNFPEINWDLEYVTTNSVEANMFLECVTDNGWHQHVHFPTRGRLGNVSSLLDLIITDRLDLVYDVRYDSPLGKSDHSVIMFRIACCCEIIQSNTTKFLYDKGDYVSIRHELGKIDWNKELSSFENDIDQQWNYIKGIYNDLIHRFIPKRTFANNSSQQVKGRDKYSREITRAIKRKNRLWQRYMETKKRDVWKVKNK